MTNLKKKPRPKIVKERKSTTKRSTTSPRVLAAQVTELLPQALSVLKASGTELDHASFYVLLRNEYHKLNDALFEKLLARLMKEKNVVFNEENRTLSYKAPKPNTGVVLVYANNTPMVVDDVTGFKHIIGSGKTNVLPGDKISYSLSISAQSWDDDFLERAKVIEITERTMTEVIGEVKERVRKGQRTLYFKKLDPRLSHLSVEVQGGEAAIEPFLNKKVVAKILTYPSDANASKLVIVPHRVLEVDNDADLEIELAVRLFDLPHEFSASTMDEADALPERVYAKDRARRVDLRDVPLCTIDGEDARDFDDAVYAQAQEDGSYRLVVAIADVSYYVKPESAIDKDAQLRSTSVYFPRRVIPMLPEKLSNGLCSLNPGVDRCALVCDMVIDPLGTVTAYQFYPAVIHSHARLTYTKVWEYLSGKNVNEREVPEVIRPKLDALYALYKVLHAARAKRGAIDFSTQEAQIITNDVGEITAIKARALTDANRLIEECMLAANTAAADFINQHKRLCLYRIHDAPSPERLVQLREVLSGFGLKLGGGNKPSATDYEKVIEAIADKPYRDVLEMALLRSMQRAVYSPDNIGHYGLGYEAYTHFTSPIRRYPDLLVHRTIRSILSRRRFEPTIYSNSFSVLSGFSGKSLERTLMALPKAQGPFVPGKDAWDQLGRITSACERRADEASRDVVAWLKCRFMKSLANKKKRFTARITAVSQYGLYVQLSDVFVEGFVHISNIGFDYYVLTSSGTIVGQDFGEEFAVGDTVRVRLIDVDEDRRRIDFRMN